jgi:hypothetical protein
MLVGLVVWIVWWLALGRPGWGVIGLAAFVSIAEAWPLYEAVVQIRQGRRKWVKPPGLGIALYAVGSVWFVVLLTALFVAPWFGPYAGSALAAAEVFGVVSLAGAAWLSWRIGTGRL